MKKLIVTLFSIALFLNIISLIYVSPRKEDQVMNVIFSFLFLLLGLSSKFKKTIKMEKKIELIPGTRVTIETKDDGSTITIYEKETPSYQFKDGDFVRSTSDLGNEWAYIYKCIEGEDIIIFHVLYSVSLKQIEGYYKCGIGGANNQVYCRLCTEEERQTIIDALEKDGKRWNPVSKKVENIKWEPKHGDHYFHVSSYGEILGAVYIEYCESDKTRLSIGNFFKTEEQAEAAAERIKKLLAEIQANLYK